MYIVGDVAASFANRPAGNGPPGAPEENELTYSSIASVNLPEIRTNQAKRDFTAPVTSSVIDAKENLVGFQGDFTFDDRAVTFASEPVQKAGLTAGNWNVMGNVLPGSGSIRTLRVSAYSNDFIPLIGSGPLFELKMKQLNNTGADTRLIWAAPPNNLIFIDADLNPHRPGRAAPGSITVSKRHR